MSSAVRSLFSTTPGDRKHFPATNQAHFCWQKYNEFVLCVKRNDGDEDTCKDAKKLAVQICPEDWINNWDEQRANGVFLGVQEKAAEAHGDHHH